jgi:kojibiose phosphorylase
LHAASQLGLPPQQCVVFEDAEAGIQAALEGGMWAVGVGPENRVGEAHIIIPNFDGVTWPDLLKRLNNMQQNSLIRQRQYNGQ